MNDRATTQKNSALTYSIGFFVSLLLTLAAYFVVTNRVAEGVWLVAIIVGLALIQLLVQLYFFLHLGQEAKPRWKLLTFGFMILVLIILVFGSLWIMQNLDYNMMHGRELDEYIMDDEGIRR